MCLKGSWTNNFIKSKEIVIGGGWGEVPNYDPAIDFELK